MSADEITPAAGNLTFDRAKAVQCESDAIYQLEKDGPEETHLWM